jgi:two-component system sensor histidine kinase KdpD
VDVVAAVAEACEQASVLARVKGVVLSIRLPERQVSIMGDAHALRRLFLILLDNAVKYTPGDSPIRIMATSTGEAVTVEVADHGPGLPRGEEDRVFEKFYRATPGGRGAGLGLAISQGIVKAHGGNIWAQNLPEGGVAFLFTLPLAGKAPASVPADA